MGSAVDRVTARALRRSLDPSADPQRTIAELVALAGNQPWVCAQALWRLDAAQGDRPSPVLTRARRSLADALAATMTAVGKGGVAVA
jgi:hypothetical protein